MMGRMTFGSPVLNLRHVRDVACPEQREACTVGIRVGNGFLGTSGHRQMMNSSVMNLQHRLVLELSVGLSFDQRQAPSRFY